MKNILPDRIPKDSHVLNNLFIAKIRKKKVISIISSLFILLFLYAGISKLLDFQNFKTDLDNSPVLSVFAVWIAWIIPLIEVLVSILLFLSKWRLRALYASLMLMVLFTTYIIIILNFSNYIPCTCGGILESLTWNQHLVFNFLFILLSIVGIKLYENINNADK